MRIAIAAVATALTWMLTAGAAPAASIDPFGDLYANCNPGYLTGHEFRADGTHIYRFKGQCDYGDRTSIANLTYFVEGSWDGQRAREHVNLIGVGAITSEALCTNVTFQGVQLVDPWLGFASCTTTSRSRVVQSKVPSAALLAMDLWTAPDPHSASFLSAAEKQALAQQVPMTLSVVPQAQVVYPPDGYAAKFGEKVSFHVIADPNDQLKLTVLSPGLVIYSLSASKVQGKNVYQLYQFLTPGEIRYQFGSPFINPSPVRKLVVGNP